MGFCKPGLQSVKVLPNAEQKTRASRSKRQPDSEKVMPSNDITHYKLDIMATPSWTQGPLE